MYYIKLLQNSALIMAINKYFLKIYCYSNKHTPYTIIAKTI